MVGNRTGCYVGEDGVFLTPQQGSNTSAKIFLVVSYLYQKISPHIQYKTLNMNWFSTADLRRESQIFNLTHLERLEVEKETES